MLIRPSTGVSYFLYGNFIFPFAIVVLFIERIGSFLNFSTCYFFAKALQNNDTCTGNKNLLLCPLSIIIILSIVINNYCYTQMIY